jgi:hypothetical protein
MERSVKVELGEFALNGIEGQLGSDVEGGVCTALIHYLHRLKSPRKPVAPPRFLGGMVAPTGSEAGVIELPLGADAEAALYEEAVRHRVSVGEVLVHAVLTYLADHDLATTGEAGLRQIVPDAPLL